MCRLLLVVLAYCSSSCGRAAPYNIPWKSDENMSNLQLLHPVLSSKPDESFSKIPAAAFTLNPDMTKRHNELNDKMAALKGQQSDITNLFQVTEDFPDMYVILVKKHESEGGNDVRDDDDGIDVGDNDVMNVGVDKIFAPKYYDANDVTASIVNSIVSNDDLTDDDHESVEYRTPAGSIFRHKPHYYGSSLFSKDQFKARNEKHTDNIPLYKKASSHSIYLNKDFDTKNLDDSSHINRVIPKIFPSKFMFEEKAEKRPEPLVVYVNEDLPIDSPSYDRSLYKQRKVPLPMSVYVDNHYQYHDRNDDEKTLQELISDMHDTHDPKPIKVYITKEEPQENEGEEDAEHMNDLMHKIRNLNKLLHGDNSPEPYTMYVNEQVISSEEAPTPTAVQHQHEHEHLDTESGESEDSEQLVVKEICNHFGAAFCAGNLQISRRDGEVGEKGALEWRRKGRHRLGRAADDVLQLRARSRAPHTWSVINSGEDLQLKQYVYMAQGQQPFVI